MSQNDRLLVKKTVFVKGSNEMAQKASRWIACTIFCIGIFSELFVCRANAAVLGPTAQLERSIEGIRLILFDASLDEGAKKIRVNESLRDLFDFREMSKLTLDRYWKINVSRQDEFSKAFTGFLNRVYFVHLDKIKDAQVIYISEETGILKSIVKIELRTRNSINEIDVKLHRIEERWSIYDISFEGVSLVQNYRAQFMHILSRKSFDELLQMIQEKKSK